MKTPPLLLFAALLFWGWQSGFLVVSAIMGIVLESAYFIKARWELRQEDFRRIWQFCTLLVLAVVFYAFAANDEDGGLTGLAHASGTTATRHIGVSATTFLRWLPMSLFLLIFAQIYSERGAVPLSAISLFLNRRRKGMAERDVNISYPYFMVCLFSAGIHNNKGEHSYFWGQAVLLAWALWPLRSRRYQVAAWIGMLGLVLGLGFFSQYSLGELQRMINVYNARWMSTFWTPGTDPSKSITAIGHIGRLKLSPQIVVRLETKNNLPPPEYLREASYRRYGKEMWSAGAGRNDFDSVSTDTPTNQTSWTLVRGKTNGPIIQIACYLTGRSQDSRDPEGLLPLPIDTSHLENLHAYLLSTNKIGAVMATGPGLVLFDAQYGENASFESPPDTSTNNFDLFVPTNEIPALDKIIAEMKLSSSNDRDKMRAAQQFFAANFTYSTWVNSDKIPRTTNETPLARFLLTSRSGHCEYFATATVLLMRELGIPTRYAVGYYVHEHSGRKYVARGRDAHAWCLVWNGSARKWENFDTTPGSWVAAEEERGSNMQWFFDLISGIRFRISKIWWGQENFRQYILWALVPMLAFLLYQIVFRRGRKRRAKSGNEKSAPIFWPGLDSEFYLLERKLAARGVPRHPSEPLSDWLARALREPALIDLQKPLEKLLRLHYAHRFDPRGLSSEEREALTRETKAALDALSQIEKRPARDIRK